DSDCNPVPGCTTKAKSIFAQGETWKAYQESMPANCGKSNSGEYAVRHNPPPYYTTLKGCAKFDVPYTQLATDLKNNKLPAFSFIHPSLTNDMQDGTGADVNEWLAKNLPPIFAGGACRGGSTAVFAPGDEGGGGTSNRCSTTPTDAAGHVATL